MDRLHGRTSVEALNVVQVFPLHRAGKKFKIVHLFPQTQVVHIFSQFYVLFKFYTCARSSTSPPVLSILYFFNSILYICVSK